MDETASPEDAWDFETQQAETIYTCEQLRDRQNIKPRTEIALDFFFKPSPDHEPRREAFEKVLDAFGYTVAETGNDEVQAGISPVPFSPSEIWIHEERVTKMALSRGYVPDGWGFAEPD